MGGYRSKSYRHSLSPVPGSHSSRVSDVTASLLTPDRSHSTANTVLDKSTMLLNMVECIDFYDVGNVLGEIGILENRENEIDAICETDVQVFLIERNQLENLMLKYPVLRDRMWKILGVHIASTLLIKLAEYQVCNLYWGVSFVTMHT